MINKTKTKKRSRDGKKNQAILKSATRLFLKNGYINTSMDAIAEAASVTKQTVYSHYSSKDELFTQMVTQLCKKHAPLNPALKNKALSAEETLYKIGLEFFDMFVSKDVLNATILVVSEARNHPKLAKNYYESGTLRILAMIEDFLTQENIRGTLKISNASEAASYFFSLLKGEHYVKALLGLEMASDAEKSVHVKGCVDVFMRIYPK
ncbi:MAG: TetR/AcrR family transcriptional regulator [Pseudomonadota bacterium]